ncbi:MAG: class I SAM-dependent methyltransferase [Oscillospiraceae bacterium]|jgi:23S rRNA (cytosine1962-C5)-methyltransferase|nr:class I SAM-dependent methyltransferase [Oscillospiraceae bacterium]
MYTTTNWQDFAVLDTGDGEKLERWGAYTLRRPDPQVIWPKQDPARWETADAWYHRSERGGGSWSFARTLPERWALAYGDLRFHVRPTGFKHTGLFPEQAANWDWMRGLIKERGEGVRVLNLFAYTGGATLACAAAGATVCHVDAAKGMVQWARENHTFSGLPADSARWIIDDALKFVQREIRRGNRYDGILMDPPSYGRGPGGEVWKLEDQVFALCDACAQALSDTPLFFLLNAYTTGLQPAVLTQLLRTAVVPRHGGRAEAGELVLPIESGGLLPCGASGRWSL